MENPFDLRDYRLEVDGDGLEGLGATEGGVETGSQWDEETTNELDNQ